MISVIVYGRNDSYGYNLHKRAAISLNCIAEVLTDPTDEILFVDCNTPNGMPTFPEAIVDTLTAKTRSCLRVFRLRPELYEKHKKGSRLLALEPLSRNIALRRSNPANRWILSTNTDMVFVLRDPAKSLSEVAGGLSDGLYELPRFEVPGALWETVDRNDPGKIISQFAYWGKRLHLNLAVISRPQIRFDGPGDFQLMPRAQLFSIHGFNEEMVLGWHVDSNLCHRLFLLNGKTESLLDEVFAYHCDHTRQVTAMHDSAQRTENSQKRFIYEVRTPYLPNQESSWGLPGESIEELRLTHEWRGSYDRSMESILPGMGKPVAFDSYLDESYDQSQVYDNFHVMPFLADCINDTARSATVGYFGGNVELVELLQKYLNDVGRSGKVLVERELIASAFRHLPIKLPENCRVSDTPTLLAHADIVIFDAGIMHLGTDPTGTDTRTLIDAEIADDFRANLTSTFYQAIILVRKRSSPGSKFEKQFLLIGAHHTWFEKLVLAMIGTTVTPYGTHIRQGFALKIPQRSTRRGLLGLIRRDPGTDTFTVAKTLSRIGRKYLRAGNYQQAQRILYMAFRCRPLYGKNLGRLVLAHLWGLRKLYAQHRTRAQVSGARINL
jgi:hypothetical protein